MSAGQKAWAIACEELKDIEEIAMINGDEGEELLALREENERLRKMVRDAYVTAFREGMKEIHSSQGGVPWHMSEFCKALKKEST